MPNQVTRGNILSTCICHKKTKWQTKLPEGFACPIPPSMGPNFAGRGWVISGRLVNRFGSRFGTNTKLLRQGLLAPYLR